MYTTLVHLIVLLCVKKVQKEMVIKLELSFSEIQSCTPQITDTITTDLLFATARMSLRDHVVCRASSVAQTLDILACVKCQSKVSDELSHQLRKQIGKLHMEFTTNITTDIDKCNISVYVAPSPTINRKFADIVLVSHNPYCWTSMRIALKSIFPHIFWARFVRESFNAF